MTKQLMTVAEVLKDGALILSKAGIDSAQLDSAILMEKVTDKDRSWLYAHGEEALSNPVKKEFEGLIAKRAARIPLVHLTHNREFYGLDFYINEHVLTPRVETEQMVQWATKYAPKRSRLIDIGTGSGAIAVAIKKMRPDLEIVATDITPEALAVATTNAITHNAHISFIKSDLFSAIQGVSLNNAYPPVHAYPKETPWGRFETVVTNLPYLRDDAKDELMPEVQKEPGVALFGGADGLDLYRRFLKQLPQHLAPDGYLFTECDPWQQEELIKEVEAAGLKLIEQGYFILGFQNIL